MRPLMQGNVQGTPDGLPATPCDPPSLPSLQLIEAGYNRLFLEEYAAAAERFDQALRLDELSLDASCGSLEAAIQLGKLDEASSQAMFLEVRNETGGMG